MFYVRKVFYMIFTWLEEKELNNNEFLKANQHVAKLYAVSGASSSVF